MDGKIMMSCENSEIENDGLKNRCILVKCQNQFVESQIYEKLQNKTGYYVKILNLLKMFDDTKMKLAFINLILPHAIKYYKMCDMKIPDKLKCYKIIQ